MRHIPKFIAFFLLVAPPATACQMEAEQETDGAGEEEKEEFRIEIRADLDQLNRELERLGKEIEVLGDEAARGLSEAYQDLRRQTGDLSDRLQQIEKRTGEAWAALRENLERAVNRIEDEIEKLDIRIQERGKEQESSQPGSPGQG